MAFLKLIRRKLSKPLFTLCFITIVWYSVVFMFEGQMTQKETDKQELYDIRLQQALENTTHAQMLQQVKPLEPMNINEGQPKRENSHFLDKNEENLGNLNNGNLGPEINGKEREKEDNKTDEKLQINPPIKEFPKADVIVKKGLGEYGKPVNISKDSLTVEEMEEYKDGWKKNAFNEFLSNRISLNRSLQDPRDEKCKHIKYSDDLPDISVIITVHNEAWTVLLRSIHSIINRTPEKLLKEIILADDYSDRPHLGKPLEKYISKLKKVKIVRAPRREGLIRARLMGYRAATGTVLVFLDSHIECAVGWLEPMLDRIHQDWTTVMTPTIDVVNDATFGFQFQEARGTNVGGFDWNLVFTWHAIPESERKRRNYEDHLPVRTPTMAGGLFAINREYFTKIGTYDDGMDIWGGENLEISFRIWMCGGTMETAPCSHIGHIFRKRTPYRWRDNVNVLLKNNLRLAEVWLDEYKLYYYERIGGSNVKDFGNITSRIELRKNLQCKSFDWFLRNVYPEMWVPAESTCFGQIKAKTQPLCLSGVTEYGKTDKMLSLFPCANGGQYWYLTLAKEIKRDYGCFDYSGQPDIQVSPCHQMGGNQQWAYKEDNTLCHISANKCLEISADGKKLFMNTCIGTDNQIWLWNRQRPDGPTRNWNAVN